MAWLAIPFEIIIVAGILMRGLRIEAPMISHSFCKRDGSPLEPDALFRPFWLLVLDGFGRDR